MPRQRMGAARTVHCFRIGPDVDVLQKAKALPVHSIAGAKQRGLVVDSIASVGDEGARDSHDLAISQAEVVSASAPASVHSMASHASMVGVRNLVVNHNGRRAIPSCEGCRAMCYSQPAVRERRAIGLAAE